MKQLILLLVLGTCFSLSQAQKQIVKKYFPGAVWEKREATVSFDTAKLAAAVAYAKQHESKAPRDLELAHAMTFGKEPFGDGVGPFSVRGDATGLIVHKGYLIAEWGDPSRVDMTFSVTKSFLSTVVGLAVDRGLIRSVHDTVAG